MTHLRTLISAAGATVTRPAKALKRTAVPPVGALAYAQIVKDRQRNNVYAFVLDNILDWNDFEGKRGATRVSVRCTAHEKKKEKKKKNYTHKHTHTHTTNNTRYDWYTAGNLPIFPDDAPDRQKGLRGACHFEFTWIESGILQSEPGMMCTITRTRTLAHTQTHKHVYTHAHASH